MCVCRRCVASRLARCCWEEDDLCHSVVRCIPIRQNHNGIFKIEFWKMPYAEHSSIDNAHFFGPSKQENEISCSVANTVRVRVAMENNRE